MGRIRPLALCLMVSAFLLPLASCQAAANTPPAAVVTATPQPAATVEPTPFDPTRLATIDAVVVAQTAEGVTATISGKLADRCTEIDTVAQQVTGSNFHLAVRTTHSADLCSAEAIPFSEVVALDSAALGSGFYIISAASANELSTSFAYDANSTAAAGTAATLRGVIWHDLCSQSGAEVSAQLALGCVAAGGRVRANGRLEDGEPRLEKVVVNLGLGACPAQTVVLKAESDVNGDYQFAQLPPGAYCVFVPLTGSNRLLLSPGEWTAPAADGGYTVKVAASEVTADLNFGWDYALLPRSAEAAACEDKAYFIADVTLPDGAAVTAGSTFTKTWQVQNIGTCTWTPSYSLVYTVGSWTREGAPAAVSLPQAVVPGGVVDLSVVLIAPGRAGEITGSWLLANEVGQQFGVGLATQGPLTLRLAVSGR